MHRGHTTKHHAALALRGEAVAAHPGIGGGRALVLLRRRVHVSPRSSALCHENAGRTNTVHEPSTFNLRGRPRQIPGPSSLRGLWRVLGHHRSGAGALSPELVPGRLRRQRQRVVQPPPGAHQSAGPPAPPPSGVGRGVVIDSPGSRLTCSAWASRPAPCGTRSPGTAMTRTSKAASDVAGGSTSPGARARPSWPASA